MDITLNVRRQQSTSAPGQLVACQPADLDPDMSFLKMLDVRSEAANSIGQRWCIRPE